MFIYNAYSQFSSEFILEPLKKQTLHVIQKIEDLVFSLFSSIQKIYNSFFHNQEKSIPNVTVLNSSEEKSIQKVLSSFEFREPQEDQILKPTTEADLLALKSFESVEISESEETEPRPFLTKLTSDESLKVSLFIEEKAKRRKVLHAINQPYQKAKEAVYETLDPISVLVLIAKEARLKTLITRVPDRWVKLEGKITESLIASSSEILEQKAREFAELLEETSEEKRATIFTRLNEIMQTKNGKTLFAYAATYS